MLVGAVAARCGARTFASVDRAPSTESTPAAIAGTSGPWGKLAYTRIELEPPPELVKAFAVATEPRWHFAPGTRNDVLTTLRNAGVTPEHVEACLSRGNWQSTVDDQVLVPPQDVVLALSPDVRLALYATLAERPQNGAQREPLPIPRTLVEGAPPAGLTLATLARLRGLLYGQGSWRLLADLGTLLATLPDEAERLRVTGVLLRAESYVLRTRIDATTDVDAVASYWSLPGRSGALRPFIESLTRVPGGADVGVFTLAPAFLRDHANRYPHRTDPIESRADCFWSALNFSRPRPDAPVDDPAFVSTTLRTRFHPMSRPAVAGDLVVLLNAKGAPVHAAVYLADGLVFTKNGQSILRPWTIMKLDSMVGLYEALAGKLRVVFATDRDDPPRFGRLVEF